MTIPPLEVRSRGGFGWGDDGPPRQRFTGLSAWIRVERLKGSNVTVQPLERHPGQPLLDEVRALLAWLRERREDGSGILFVSSHGAAMDRSTFYRLWRRLAQVAGLRPETWHPHTGKHSAGLMLAKSGANAYAIKAYLGHKSIASSAVYCQLADGDAAKVARAAWMQAL
jgi:integrase